MAYPVFMQHRPNAERPQFYNGEPAHQRHARQDGKANIAFAMPIPQMRAAGYQPIFYALQGQPLRAVAVQPHLKKSVQVAFAPAQGHQHQHYQQPETDFLI